MVKALWSLHTSAIAAAVHEPFGHLFYIVAILDLHRLRHSAVVFILVSVNQPLALLIVGHAFNASLDGLRMISCIIVIIRPVSRLSCRLAAVEVNREMTPLPSCLWGTTAMCWCQYSGDLS